MFQITLSLNMLCILFRPMVKYVGNIHGDEAVTREVLLGLAQEIKNDNIAGNIFNNIGLSQYLVLNYGTDERITKLLNKTEVKL